jgi:hypothetical protein
VDVADDEVVVTATELELETIKELLDKTEDEVLLGAEVPSGEHIPPRAETSLKVSPDDPLTAPYLDPTADATA